MLLVNEEEPREIELTGERKGKLIGFKMEGSESTFWMWDKSIKTNLKYSF
jgi:hypothetical protein